MPGDISYGKSIFIGIDQLINAILGGWPDETLSSASYRMDRDGVRSWPCALINKLFFWQKNHCKSAYESEVLRRQAPPETR